MNALHIAMAIVKWGLMVAFILAVLLLLLAEVLDRYWSTAVGAYRLYRKIPADGIVLKYASSGVRYARIGDRSLQPLLLIHGAPGSLFDWKSLAKRSILYDRYYLLVVERPGYGGTRPREPLPSIVEQAKRLGVVLEEEEAEAVVIAGHSYGAPISLVLAALQPERVAHVYGLSGQYDPENEVVFGVSHWVKYWPFRYLMPRILWVSNIEKLSHAEAQREALSYYTAVKAPVTLVHGDADKLVPFANSVFVKQQLERTPAPVELITLEGKRHPIQLQMPHEIAVLLLRAGLK